MKPEFFPGQVIRLQVGYNGHIVHTLVLTTSVEYDLDEDGSITKDIIEETFNTSIAEGCTSLGDLESRAELVFRDTVSATIVSDPRLLRAPPSR